jgi:shikimate-5-dehydrogenase
MTDHQIPARKYFIFGHNISHSLSPTIHNTAFAELGLPHHYSIHQTPDIDESVKALISSPDFGGASVTFPHKLKVRPLLDSISESATTLGAINTIIAEESATGHRTLRGDNTDWLGIQNCIRQTGISTQCTRAIVVGAGGAARGALYALLQLGVRDVAVVNRTRETAERLVADFPGLRIDISSDSLRGVTVPASLIVSCIPADDVREEDIPSTVFADGKGVCIDMAYRPRVTALMRVAGRREGWTVQGGVDVLKVQAYAQFELWTGKSAPVEVIEAALAEKSSGQ